ncbi:MAG: bacterial Ig-like domain-containing protein, partial [Clostridia bacterium]|nr:bacterial Ig-like domain-containing protein [Clostridia bacterium]
MKKRLFIIVFIALLMSLLYACDADIVLADAKVESISVDGMMQQYYFVGDELSLTAATLYVQYDDGTIDQIPVTADMVDPSFNTDKSGIISVKINYKQVSTSFNIEDLDLVTQSVEIGTFPEKTNYIEGTPFDVTGGTLRVRFEGGRTIDMPILANNVTHYNPDVVGPQTVRITYRTESLEIPIVVVPKELQSISVKTPPTAKSVYIGHEINPLGMILNFHYNNGKVEEVNSRFIDEEQLEFKFNNERATPSTEVKVLYTKYPEDMVFETEFKIQVLFRRWKSMRIKQYPITNGILLESAKYDEFGNIVTNEVRTPSTTLQNIIQGDTINLSSGEVEVTFDDGTIGTYRMSDNLLKVYNVQSTEKSEIRGLTIEPLEKKDVPVGDCILDYEINVASSLYDYENDYQLKITATDSSGAAVPVIKSGENTLIEIRNAQVYTVTITASVDTIEEIDGVNQQVTHVTAKSYRILAVNAVEPRRTLDISSAGDYVLSVIYMENTDWSIPLNVKVVSRAPVSLELSNYGDVTGKQYIVGDKINISFMKYRMIYDNGDTDPWTPVEARMLSPDITLDCAEATSADNMKVLTYSLYDIES